MGTMLDANSAALRLFEMAEERAESLHEAYGKQVIQGIVDDFFDGRKVGRLTLHDFMGELTDNDLAPLFLTTNGDEQLDRLMGLTRKIERSIREWCEGEGAEYVAELEREEAEV